MKKPHGMPSSTAQRSRTVYLVLFFASLFALVGRGTLTSSDEGGIFNTAIAMASGTLATPPGENVYRGRDGRYYSLRETLPSAAAVPFVAIGGIVESRVEAAPPIARGPKEFGEDLFAAQNWPVFLVSLLVGPLCIGMTLTWLYKYWVIEGINQRSALTLALIVGWTTPLVVYSKTIFPQVFEAAILMFCFWTASRWRDNQSAVIAFQLGVGCALGVLARPVFAPVVLCFAAFLLATGQRNVFTRFKRFMSFCAPVVIGVSTILAVNWYKWGSPLDFGYHGSINRFSTNPLIGITGLLISPGRGIFIYVPLLLAPTVFCRSILRQRRAEFILLSVITCVYFAIYGAWYDWPGGLSWGPRFLTALIAPWMALAGGVLNSPDLGRRVFLIVAGAWGFVVQLLGWSVYTHWIRIPDYPNAFAFFDGYIGRTALSLWKRGPDDLWLFNAQSAPQSFIWTIIGLAVMLMWALARVRRPGSQNLKASNERFSTSVAN